MAEKEEGVMFPKHYITTTIPYVNARPHVGFALELVQADVQSRFQRLRGTPVRFQTGTDENAFKNVEAARAEGVPTQAFVDRNASAFRSLAECLRISFDDFVRTTETRHRHGVEAFWRRLAPGDLYRKRYEGLYCTGCEDFLSKRDLKGGRCADHGTPPVPVDEENVFFRLSKYQAELDALIDGDRVAVVPGNRKREVLQFIRRGLRDISVSREARRSGGWGIPVPGDPDQVVYVWIDALVNYVSGPGLGSGETWRDWWSAETAKTHLVGKNVWKFHAVYWPALLLSAGLSPPDRVVVHGFLTENGRRISKTRGNTVDPFEVVGDVGADPLRYYLLRAVSPFEDGDFSLERLREVHDADLANGLGNLASRLTALASRVPGLDFLPDPDPAPPPGFLEEAESYRFGRALRILWEILREVNVDVERVKPWTFSGEEKIDRLRPALHRWLGELNRVSHWVSPFLPDTGERLQSLLRERPLQPCQPLFPKLR
jgi:methionyl-tRNA synthetase